MATLGAGALLAASLVLPSWFDRFLAVDGLLAGPFLRWSFAAIGVAMLAWTAARWRDLEHDERPRRLALLAWALPICATTAYVSAPDSYAPAVIVPYLLLWTLLIAPRLAIADADVRLLIALASLVVAGSVLLEAQGLWPPSRFQHPGGLLRNRNYAGEYLAISLPALVTWAARRWRIGVALVVGVALAWTRCRGAWLGGAVGLLVVVLTAKPRLATARAAVLVLAGMVVAPMVPSALRWRQPAPYSTTLRTVVDLSQGSGALRLQQHTTTWALVRARGGLGLGAGQWREAMFFAYAGEAAQNRAPHSEYLRALADGGVAAVIGLAAFLVLCALQAARACAPERLAAIAALAVVAAANAPLVRLEQIGLVALILTTGMSGARRERHD